MFSEDLVERLVEHRRQMASLEAECTSLVAEMIRRRFHEDLGYRSLTSLLIDRLGVSAGVARGMVRTANAAGIASQGSPTRTLRRPSGHSLLAPHH